LPDMPAAAIIPDLEAAGVPLVVYTTPGET
jgi:hypothetical protein